MFTGLAKIAPNPTHSAMLCFVPILAARTALVAKVSRRLASARAFASVVPEARSPKPEADRFLDSDWTEKAQGRQREGKRQTPSLNLARLSPHLLEFGSTRHRFGSRVHVALTARRQTDSRAPNGLKHSKGSHPEGQEQRQPP